MGGTMFNGLTLVRELCKHGHDVTVLNRGKTEAVLPRGVQRLFADRTDEGALRQTLGGLEFDCVFDVSAYRPEDVRLMTEIFRGRTGHYVFISSTVIYAASDLLPIHEGFPLDRGESQNEYGSNKIACEDFLFGQHREHGFPATVVALSMVFGPNNILPDREQRMFMRLLRGRKILIPGDGTTLGQVGHVEDQARALRMVMGQPVTFGKRYNLTGADCFTSEGYVDVFSEVLGVSAEKVFVDPGLMDDLFDGRIPLAPAKPDARIDVRTATSESQLAVARFMLAFLVQRLAPNIHRWNSNVVFGIDRLRRDVGWEPEFTFPAAVEQTWDWFRREGLDERDIDFEWEDELLRQVEARG
jgi:nucleoside-diphosphate-sugar epimerase